MGIYDYTMKDIKGRDVPLSEYKGKLVMIVNIANKCGFTPQYKGLEKLYSSYKDKGFVILGFPCDQFLHQMPGTGEQISSFCKMNYGVSFPLFAKIEVNGPQEAPLYTYLKKTAPFRGFEAKDASKVIQKALKENYPDNLTGDGIKWNFTKFLISRDGAKVTRFEPTMTPEELDPIIRKSL